jgi:hypothetical protein
MIMNFFSSQGWESWDVAHRPLIPERMPVLVDTDLRFEDGPGAPRPTTVVNRWLRELPASGAPAPNSWETYARTVKEWMEFVAEHDVALFDSREQLKLGLSRYAEHRATGPARSRGSTSDTLSGSSGETRILRLAASLAGGVPVNLGDAVTGLDHTNIDLLVQVILGARRRKRAATSAREP